MTRERFLERFSDDSGFLVIPPKGEPWRMDGKPLTQADKEAARGKPVKHHESPQKNTKNT